MQYISETMKPCYTYTLESRTLDLATIEKIIFFPQTVTAIFGPNLEITS